MWNFRQQIRPETPWEFHSVCPTDCEQMEVGHFQTSFQTSLVQSVKSWRALWLWTSQTSVSGVGAGHAKGVEDCGKVDSRPCALQHIEPAEHLALDADWLKSREYDLHTFVLPANLLSGFLAPWSLPQVCQPVPLWTAGDLAIFDMGQQIALVWAEKHSDRLRLRLDSD